MAFRGDINALILGALHSGPQHGYQIVKAIRGATSAQKLAEGQVYPYLHRLEREGAVAAEWQTDTGGPARRVYQLTESGLKQLDQHRRVWREFSQGIGSLLESKGDLTEAWNA